MIGIYKITNTINGNAYIGQSTNIAKRFHSHKAKSQNRYLRFAINKYGVENFKFEIIKLISDSKLKGVLLDCYEEYYIKLYNTLNRNFGYNAMHGGQPGRLCPESLELMKRNSAGKLKGYKHSNVAIENMKRAQSNRSEIWRNRLSKSQKNKIVSEETREKIRAARQNQIITEETKRKIATALSGKKKSQAHIAKVSEKFKEWLKTEEGLRYKEKLSLRMKNRVVSEETRRKMSNSAKKRKST